MRSLRSAVLAIAVVLAWVVPALADGTYTLTTPGTATGTVTYNWTNPAPLNWVLSGGDPNNGFYPGRDANVQIGNNAPYTVLAGVRFRMRTLVASVWIPGEALYRGCIMGG